MAFCKVSPEICQIPLSHLDKTSLGIVAMDEWERKRTFFVVGPSANYRFCNWLEKRYALKDLYC
jgi:hypothetical protein